MRFRTIIDMNFDELAQHEMLYYVDLCLILRYFYLSIRIVHLVNYNFWNVISVILKICSFSLDPCILGCEIDRCVFILTWLYSCSQYLYKRPFVHSIKSVDENENIEITALNEWHHIRCYLVRQVKTANRTCVIWIVWVY